MPGLLVLWPAKALSPSQITKGGAQSSATLTSQAIRGLLATGTTYASGSDVSQAVRGLLAAGVAYAEARGLSQATRGLLASGLAIAVASDLSQAVRGLRAAGAAASVDRLLSQAIRGLVAQGAAYALDAALLSTFHGQIRALLGIGSAGAAGTFAWTGIPRQLSAVGLAVAADLGLLFRIPPAFTRGLVSVRSGDAVMPGIATPDPRWGNTGGPVR